MAANILKIQGGGRTAYCDLVGSGYVHVYNRDMTSSVFSISPPTARHPFIAYICSNVHINRICVLYILALPRAQADATPLPPPLSPPVKITHILDPAGGPCITHTYTQSTKRRREPELNLSLYQNIRAGIRGVMQIQYRTPSMNVPTLSCRGGGDQERYKMYEYGGRQKEP